MGEAMDDFYRSLFFQLSNPLFHRGFADIHPSGSVGNGVVLIEYKQGHFGTKPVAEIMSVKFVHNVTCINYEVKISPLLR